jgi:sRNA-binding regulator protein Hfq
VRSFSISVGLLATIAFTAMSALPARADAGGDLENALLNTFKQPSYHMRMNMVNGNVIDGDVVTPDRMHIVMKSGEMIAIGQTTYFKLNGAWQKLPGVNPMLTRADLLHTLQASKGKYSVADLGMKVVDGVPLHAYRTTDLANKKTTMIYVDGRQRIVRIDTGADIMRFTRFGENVSITPPM